MPRPGKGKRKVVSDDEDIRDQKVEDPEEDATVKLAKSGSLRRLGTLRYQQHTRSPRPSMQLVDVGEDSGDGSADTGGDEGHRSDAIRSIVPGCAHAEAVVVIVRVRAVPHHRDSDKEHDGGEVGADTVDHAPRNQGRRTAAVKGKGKRPKQPSKAPGAKSPPAKNKVATSPLGKHASKRWGTGKTAAGGGGGGDDDARSSPATKGKSVGQCQTASEDDKVTMSVGRRKERDPDPDGNIAVSVVGDAIHIRQPGQPGQVKQFTFDRSFGMEAGQDTVYAGACLVPMDRFVAGYNSCVFCYGQTGSGKTWTMLGEPDDTEKLGLIPRALEATFAYTEDNVATVKSKLTASCLEVYNEQLQDLNRGDGQTVGKLNILEDKVKGIYVQNLSKIEVTSVDETVAVLGRAMNERVVGKTRVNAVSSRSHMIFMLELEQIDVGDEIGITRKTCTLNMVDLAGSERQSATGAQGKQLKEGAAINLSLTMLGKVINALARKLKFVPYRDSKLTRLLQNSLGGNSFTVMIATVNPTADHVAETLSTLRFADRAKQIENLARVNVDPAHVKLLELMAENDLLRSANKELSAKLARDTARESKAAKSRMCTVS